MPHITDLKLWKTHCIAIMDGDLYCDTREINRPGDFPFVDDSTGELSKDYPAWAMPAVPFVLCSVAGFILNSYDALSPWYWVIFVGMLLLIFPLGIVVNKRHEIYRDRYCQLLIQLHEIGHSIGTMVDLVNHTYPGKYIKYLARNAVIDLGKLGDQGDFKAKILCDRLCDVINQRHWYGPTHKLLMEISIADLKQRNSAKALDFYDGGPEPIGVTGISEVLGRGESQLLRQIREVGELPHDHGDAHMVTASLAGAINNHLTKRFGPGDLNRLTFGAIQVSRLPHILAIRNSETGQFWQRDATTLSCSDGYRDSMDFLYCAISHIQDKVADSGPHWSET